MLGFYPEPFFCGAVLSGILDGLLCRDPVLLQYNFRGSVECVFPVFYIISLDGERFLQSFSDPFLGFALISWVSPKISQQFGPIYYHHSLPATGTRARTSPRIPSSRPSNPLRLRGSRAARTSTPKPGSCKLQQQRHACFARIPATEATRRSRRTLRRRTKLES